MTHRVVEGSGLRTSYAYAPQLTISTERDGPTSVRMAFPASPITRAGQESDVTVLTFTRVAGYCWNDFEYHRLPSNVDDAELGLIEISDSQMVAEILATGRYVGAPLRHFRITFDDHGTYDVVCQSFDIAG
jgi:hypothetical protein